jgi:hypothetical protein
MIYVNHCTAVSLGRLLNLLTMKASRHNKYSLQVTTMTENLLKGESYRFHKMGVNHSFIASSGNVFIVLKF